MIIMQYFNGFLIFFCEFYFGESLGATPNRVWSLFNIAACVMSWRASGKALKYIRATRGVNKKIPEPIKKWNIKKGDTVQVLAGKDKGKQGKVVVVDRNFNRVYVQGLHTHMVQVKADGFSGKMQREAPLHYSNVALVDPGDGQPCRIKYMYTEDGEKVRASRRSGRIIPNPVQSKDLNRLAFPDGPMDTEAKAAARITFIPSLLTFEEEMLQKYSSQTQKQDSETIATTSS